MDHPGEVQVTRRGLLRDKVKCEAKGKLWNPLTSTVRDYDPSSSEGSARSTGSSDSASSSEGRRYRRFRNNVPGSPGRSAHQVERWLGRHRKGCQVAAREIRSHTSLRAKSLSVTLAESALASYLDFSENRGQEDPPEIARVEEPQIIHWASRSPKRLSKRLKKNSTNSSCPGAAGSRRPKKPVICNHFVSL
ncbi:hypothetical protein L596_009499 [Steinernema carpocapsae]|uniref:Uncharacterized protein n=1 Tax=Steinernema carpocapsae TaxID=34508 RepID=A0A4U5PFJ1_STECR|nr:hypothetical protein L596_009499 [Steinernema carpocapsae]